MVKRTWVPHLSSTGPRVIPCFLSHTPQPLFNTLLKIFFCFLIYFLCSLLGCSSQLWYSAGGGPDICAPEARPHGERCPWHVAGRGHLIHGWDPPKVSLEATEKKQRWACWQVFIGKYNACANFIFFLTHRPLWFFSVRKPRAVRSCSPISTPNLPLRKKNKEGKGKPQAVLPYNEPIKIKVAPPLVERSLCSPCVQTARVWWWLSQGLQGHACRNIDAPLKETNVNRTGCHVLVSPIYFTLSLRLGFRRLLGALLFFLNISG